MAAFQAARFLQVTGAGQGVSENQQAESNVRETKMMVLEYGSQKVRWLSMGAQGEPSPNTSLWLLPNHALLFIHHWPDAEHDGSALSISIFLRLILLVVEKTKKKPQIT